MEKLKIILHSKYFYFFLFGLTLLYILYSFSYIPTKYKGTETHFYGTILSIKENQGNFTLEIKAKEKLLVYYQSSKSALEVGDTIEVTGTLTKPNRNRNFHLFNYQAYLKGKQIFWIVKDANVILKKKNQNFYKIKNQLIKQIEKKANQGYFQAFILGDSSKLEFKKTYQELGISHLFAVSGMHILFIAGVLTTILKKVIKSEFQIFFITILVLTFYIWLLSDSPSANRAYLLYLFSFFNRYFHWKLKPLELLLLVFVIAIIRNPFCILQIGFQYSFTICFFLMIKHENKSQSYWKQLFSTSTLAFLASFPISISLFHEIHLGTIFFNMIAVPFVSVILFPFSFLAFFLPALEPIFSYLLDIFHFVIQLCQTFSFLKLSFMAIPIYYICIYYVVLFLGIQFSRKWFLVFLSFMIFHFLCPYLNPYYSIDMIDINQGDAILIRYPHLKQTILVDCGGINTNQTQVEHILIPYFKALGIKKIDVFIMTHGDYDHIGNALELSQKFKIGAIYMNSGHDNELETIFIRKNQHISIHKISQHTLMIGNQKFQFLNSKNQNNENEDSLVFYTQLAGKNILFMGDAGKNTEKKILEEYNLPKMDILKVGHHGSKNSSDEIFLNTIHPNIALISAGVYNRFSHPHSETVEKLQRLGSQIFSTNQFGSIQLILKRKIKIRTCFSFGTLLR